MQNYDNTNWILEGLPPQFENFSAELLNSVDDFLIVDNPHQ
jgi:hypothetical protein